MKGPHIYALFIIRHFYQECVFLLYFVAIPDFICFNR